MASRNDHYKIRKQLWSPAGLASSMDPELAGLISSSVQHHGLQI